MDFSGGTDYPDMEERKYDIRIDAGNRQLVAIENFRLARSSVNVLFGESGIGKSLIARAIYGLLDSDELSVNINGRDYAAHLNSADTAEIRRNGFFVFQEPSTHLNPMLTLGDQ
ncbi:MAG TPA: ATP-binding cassette domain-containing protein, partial [Bacteroidota bacterium]|nr:ATP-binding cassette domain-containing protein [Bacteroidota bacterium]